MLFNYNNLGTNEKIELLRQMATDTIDSDLSLADAYFKISNYLEDKSKGLNAELSFQSSQTEFDERTRIIVLYQILTSLNQIYGLDLSSKELSYSNDLIEKVEVGYFNDESVDSTFAEELREQNYSMDGKSAEISLQTRIVYVLQDVMPEGAWVVE